MIAATLKEAKYRLKEVFSLASCLANVIVGTGDRELTLSAGSWELIRQGKKRGLYFVMFIDGFWEYLGDYDHCRRNWQEHEETLKKIERDRKKSR